MNQKGININQNLIRIFSFLICCFFLSTCLSQGKSAESSKSPRARLKEKVEYYEHLPLFRTGLWAIYAEYIDSGEPVLDFNSSKVMATGSNMKIITSAAALEILGPDYRYYTDIFYDGTISDETLYGNIYIRGSGDPAFLSGIIPSTYTKEDISRLLLRELKKLELKRISGSVIADSLLFKGSSIPDDWRWLDLGTHYGTGTSALCINENMVVFSFRVEASKVTLVNISPEIPHLHLVNTLRPGNPGTHFYYLVRGLPGSHTISVSGTIPADNQMYMVNAAIPVPALLAAYTITDELRRSSVPVTGQPVLLDRGKQYNYRHKLLTIPSPPIKEIVYYLLKKSVNLYAEQLCVILGLRYYGTASTKNGIRALTAYLERAGMPMDGIKIYDGSGLSRYNKISPRLLVRLLTYIAASPEFPSFYNGLGIAGDPDDISFFTHWGQGTEIACNARIKSGSLKWVKAHSGYVTTTTGRMIAFSMIVNNYNGLPAEVEEAHQDIILGLAQLDE